MNKDGVRAGTPVCLRPPQRLVVTAARDERFRPGNNDEAVVAPRVSGGAKTPAELVDVRQLRRSVDKAVDLWKRLVLEADAGGAALLQFANEPACIVEVAVSRIAVDENRHGCRVGHEFDDIDDLSPRRLVAVTYPEARRDRQPTGPDRLEPGLLGDVSAEAVVGFDDEGQRGGPDQLAQTIGFRVHDRRQCNEKATEVATISTEFRRRATSRTRPPIRSESGRYPIGYCGFAAHAPSQPASRPGEVELMRLHAAMGNRAEALRVFARCRNRLRSELGTTPSPETEGVWRAIDTASSK